MRVLPPLPGPLLALGPRQPLIQPKAPMKPLYWTKVLLPPAQADCLLWSQLEEVEVSADKLEELFAKAVPKKATVEVSEVKVEKPGKEKPTKVIDPKKGQNVGIFMKSNKLDVAAVEEIVYRLSYTGDLETLVTLRTNQATEEELAMLLAHVEACPDKLLDLPDQFLYNISKIHQCDARLACLMFKVGFADRVAEVEMRMANISHCCSALTSRPALKKVLGVILTCGNYLNGGNKQRGQADGFAIDILPKLKDLKTSSNTGNLMDFVVGYCIEHFDEDKGTSKAVLPVPEPGDLEKCKNVDFEQERATCNVFLKEVIEMKKKVEMVTASASEDIKEPFHAEMTQFLASASTSAKEISAQVKESGAKFVECMSTYSFKPKKGKLDDAKPEEFFSAWHLFAEDFKNIWKKEQVMGEGCSRHNVKHFKIFFVISSISASC